MTSPTAALCPVTSGEAGRGKQRPAADVAPALQKLGGEAPALARSA